MTTTKTYGGKPPYPFTPGDNNTGQCSTCGEVFYGERAFDSHRRNGSCLDPLSAVSKRGNPMPYWLDAKGRWHYGERRPSDTYGTPSNHCTGTDSSPVLPVPGVTPTPSA